MSHNVCMKMTISDKSYCIAIIDDEEIYLRKMSILMRTFYPNAEIDVFLSVDAALQSGKQYAFAIIDVLLGSQNGIDASTKLTDRVSYIVYYSAAIEEIRRAFRFNTIGYLLKTDSDAYIYERFKEYEREYFSISLQLRTNQGNGSYPVRDIIRFETIDRRIYMVLRQAPESIQILGCTMREIERMSSGNLIFINRSVLVNVMQVVSVNVHTGRIKFSDGTEDYISKRLRKSVLDMFLEKRNI